MRYKEVSAAGPASRLGTSHPTASAPAALWVDLPGLAQGPQHCQSFLWRAGLARAQPVCAAYVRFILRICPGLRLSKF